MNNIMKTCSEVVQWSYQVQDLDPNQVFLGKNYVYRNLSPYCDEMISV